MKKIKSMKKKQGWALVSAALLLLFVLAGCAASKNSVNSVSSQSSVTVQDAGGNAVTIPSAPQSIVILPLWQAEMVMDLIGTDRIKAVSSFIDSEATSACAGKAAAIPNRVSSSEAEKIIGLQPDLVLLDTFNDYDGSLSATLKGAGITVLTLSSPTNFEDIKARLTTLAQAVYATDKGQEIVEDMTQRLNALKQKVSGVTSPVKVMFYEDYYSADGTNAGMLCAYGQGSTFESIAKAAGVINVCTAENYSAVSKETVLNEWKPEVLVVPSITYDAAFKAIDDQGATVIAAIKKDKILASLPAVQNNRILAISDKYRGSTSQYMVYAAEELAKACYPELFA